MKSIIKRSDSELFEKLLALEPVTFNYNEDEKNTTQYGLIAEDVAEIFPETILYDSEGNIMSVRYDKIDNLLIHAIQELHAQNQELKNNGTAQQKQIEAQKQENTELKNILVTMMSRLDKYDKLEAILNKIDVNTLAELYEDLNKNK